MISALPPSRVPAPTDAPPLRWGILGTGWIAAQFVDALRRHTRQEVVACGSRSQARADTFAGHWGIGRAWASYEHLVADADVDAIYVASPHSEHRDHALLAIQAGKHVLVEKAFTRNAAEAREVVAAARQHEVAAMEAMWTRFLPRHDVVRRLLEDGILGEVETVIADHGQWFAPDSSSRLFAPELAGGALLDLGIYPVSFTHFVLGAPGTVTARGTRAFTGVDRQISAILDAYPDAGAHALVSATLAARTPTTASISGPRGRIELDADFYTPGPVRLVAGGEVLQGDPSPIRGHEGLCFEAAHFAQLVADGFTESPLLPLDETVAVLETLDAIRGQVGVRYPGEEAQA